MTSIQNIRCPGCSRQFWVALSLPENGDLTGVDSEGFKCPHCETIFPLPNEDPDPDNPFDPENAMIFDGYKTPNDTQRSYQFRNWKEEFVLAAQYLRDTLELTGLLGTEESERILRLLEETQGEDHG